MTNTNSLRIAQVSVPSYSQFGAVTLWTCPDVTGTGLCSSRHEAELRAEQILASGKASTQAPDGQANEAEMACAAAWAAEAGIRDGGACRSAFAAALEAGIHTPEWAIASRYIMAGWAPYKMVAGQPKFVGR